MPANTKIGVITLICEGGKFGGNPCAYYEHTNSQCQLLTEQLMEVFWEKCWGAWELFSYIERTNHTYFRNTYPDTPIDDTEDFKFDEVIGRLNRQQLHIPTLAGWYKNVKVTVYREIQRNLVRRGLIPDKHTCGSCKYFPESKSYPCEKTDTMNNKGDPSCEEYSPQIPHFRSVDGDPAYKNRVMAVLNETDGNDNGADTFEIILTKIEAIAQKDPHKTQQEVLLETIKALLKKRARDEKPGSHRRKKHTRQYDIFVAYILMLSDGITAREAKKTLIEKFGYDKKMIERDMAGVRIFLKEKMSSDE